MTDCGKLIGWDCVRGLTGNRKLAFFATNVSSVHSTQNGWMKMSTAAATVNDANVVDTRVYTQEELDEEIQFALSEQLRNLPLVNLDALTDDVKLRVLDVQEFDKEKIDETNEHNYMLGLSARENSI